MSEQDHDILLTDLHCHLLPGIDDGARNLQDAARLIAIQCNSGVRQIALTSHFNYERMSLESFINRRAKAYENLLNELGEDFFERENIEFRLGAEVFFSANLFHETDIQALCMHNTNILLLELPTDRMPPYFDEVIYQIQSYNIVPIIAHIERYPYVMDNIPILCDWGDRGIYSQINAGTIIRGGRLSKQCLNLIRWNLVHIIASDAHSIEHRPPNLRDGLNVIKNKLGARVTERIIGNAHLLFNGICPEIETMYCPRKILGRWR